MSEAPQDHSKLEERVRQRSEARRKRSLDGLPLAILHASLEASPHPIIIYENNHISYANPAAVAKFGYTFEQLMTFNDVTRWQEKCSRRIKNSNWLLVLWIARRMWGAYTGQTGLCRACGRIWLKA